MYRRSRSHHTLSSRPWAERKNLVYGFSAALALRQVGTCAPLSPSPGLSQRAETTLCKNAPAFLPYPVGYPGWTEQICRDQRHREKVLFMAPSCCSSKKSACFLICRCCSRIENVRLERLLMLPKHVCSPLHHILVNRAGGSRTRRILYASGL